MQSRVLTSLVSGCMGLLALGSITLMVSGCGGDSAPKPAPTQGSQVSSSVPPTATSTPSTTSSTDVLNIAATRPKETPDPFAKPDQRGSGGGGETAVTTTPTPAETKTPDATASSAASPAPAATPTPAPTPPKDPPKPPEYTLAGIFRSSPGPEALLTGSDGTLMVYMGQRLKDDYRVKSIDVASRKVVLDKDNTDFVLPLETSKEGPGGPGALPSPPGK